MIALQGTGVSAGVASGPIRFYSRKQAVVKRVKVADAEKELARYREATDAAIAQLGELAEKTRREAGEDAALLFETHQMMLEDLDYVAAITELIGTEKVNADYAVHETGRQFAEMFSSMEDEYMRARSADVVDISTRLERILRGEKTDDAAGSAPAIIAADDLSPSETVQMAKSKILGFVLSAGHRNAHTVILARTLGIPAIIQLGSELRREYDGRTAILDGQTGQLVVDPDEATKTYLFDKQAAEREARRKLEELKGQPDVTLDGKEIRLYANISSPAILDAVLSNDARGIGLFRSEFLYLENSDYPTEDEQFAAYKAVLQRMGTRQVVIRTLDIGADKKVPYFNLPEEENPALGMRHPHLPVPARGVPHAAARAVPRVGLRQSRHHVPDDRERVGDPGDQAHLHGRQEGARAREDPLRGEHPARHHDRDARLRHHERQARQGGRFLLDRHERSHAVHAGRRPPGRGGPRALLRHAPSGRAAAYPPHDRERARGGHLGRHLRRARERRLAHGAVPRDGRGRAERLGAFGAADPQHHPFDQHEPEPGAAARGAGVNHVAAGKPAAFLSRGTATKLRPVLVRRSAGSGSGRSGFFSGTRAETHGKFFIRVDFYELRR